MYIVMLEDGTSYNIDTDDYHIAISIVEYKLKQRLDLRKIDNVMEIKGAKCDKESKYYNSGNQFDGKDLVASTGWSYRYY